MGSNMAPMEGMEELDLGTELSDLNPTGSIRLLNTHVDIPETYSPPRVTQYAKDNKGKCRLQAGWTMDLVTGINFNRNEDQKRA